MKAVIVATVIRINLAHTLSKTSLTIYEGGCEPQHYLLNREAGHLHRDGAGL